MSHKKAGSSTSLGRDSISKRLGVKKFAGEVVKSGNIIVRQRGTKFFPGTNTKMGVDNTIYATTEGKIKTYTVRKIKFNGQIKRDRYVGVESTEKTTK